MWAVPGSPLPQGRGWRIWYSNPGEDDFKPSKPVVSRGGRVESTSVRWNIPHALNGLGRRMGVLTLTLDSPAPGSIYDILIPEADPIGTHDATRLRWQSLPDSIDGGVTFFFASCYWQPNDKEGAYGAAVAELTKSRTPAFKLLIGDQVYQDYPVNWMSPKSSFDLYAERYESYWGNGAYRELLMSSPNFFLCDDHEFWNDFPEPQRHLPRTWRKADRDKITRAARDLYVGYQQSANLGGKAYYAFDIGPGPDRAESPKVSFFVADSRSERDRIDAPDPHFLKEEQWTALEAWGRSLDGPGVLVIGQPVFQKDGDWKDHSLSNFSNDYGRLWSLLERALSGRKGVVPHDVLILTGDIHSGRYAVGRLRGPTNIEIRELVASPASRVGPYLHLSPPSAQEPPARFTAEYQGRSSSWDVLVDRSGDLPTIDNNLGIVRMTPGTNGRVRFELSLSRIRPYDSRPFWSRMLGIGQPSRPVTQIFHTEVELR